MKIDRNLKIGVIGGLIAMVLFIYLLKPILSLFGQLVVTIASRVYSGYLDSLFAKAALVDVFDPALGLVILFFAGISGVITGGLIGLIRAHKKVHLGKISKEKPLRKISLRKTLISVISYNFVWYIIVISILWTQSFCSSITTSFKQHMHTVAPYLSEIEEEEIWSQWTLMKNQGDYKKIYKRLTNIAKKNGIELPKNRAYI